MGERRIVTPNDVSFGTTNLALLFTQPLHALRQPTEEAKLLQILDIHAGNRMLFDTLFT